MGKKILVIDDESIVIETIKEVCEIIGHDVVGFTDPVQGQRAGQSSDFDVIVLDLRMPHRNGAEVTREILSAKPDAKILINTGHSGDPLARQAMEAGALRLLRKPFEIANLIEFLER